MEAFVEGNGKLRFMIMVGGLMRMEGHQVINRGIAYANCATGEKTQV